MKKPRRRPGEGELLDLSSGDWINRNLADDLAVLRGGPLPFAPKLVALTKSQALDHPSRDTVPSKATVASIATVPSKDTVPRELRSKGTVSLKAGPKVYRCFTAQDGHSFAEDRLYNALWNSKHARGESPETKLVAVGWDVMAKLAGMTPRNVRENCFRLIQKLAIEKVHAHSSEQRVGTTYRIFSYTAILRQRREAGLEWVVRNRGGVSFVNTQSGDTVPLEGTVASQDTESVPSKDTETVPSEDTLLVNIEVSTSQSSSSEITTVVRTFLPTADDDGIQQLIHTCRQKAPDTSDSEIAHFIRIKAQQALEMRSVRSLLGFLMEAVPEVSYR